MLDDNFIIILAGYPASIGRKGGSDVGGREGEGGRGERGER